MSNYKFKLLIKSEEIYNTFHPEQKKLFKNIQIVKAELLDNGEVEIGCLALDNDIVETPYRQVISFFANNQITVKDT